MERRVADALTVATGQPARRQPLSGSLRWMKGDVEARDFLVECKNRTPELIAGRRTLRLNFQEVDKIAAEAAEIGKIGFLVLQPKGSPDAYVVFKLSDLLALLSRYANQEP